MEAASILYESLKNAGYVWYFMLNQAKLGNNPCIAITYNEKREEILIT